MAIGLGIKTAALSIFGVGTGHAAIGRWRRGAIWLGAVVATTALTIVTIWVVFLGVVLFVAALVDAFVLGFRAKREQELAWLGKPALIMFGAALAWGIVLQLFCLRYVVQDAVELDVPNARDR